MSGENGSVREGTSGGVSATHDSSSPLPILVGPSTEDQFNTIRMPLIPVACWRVDHIRFAFDSSFVGSDPTSDDPDDIRAELSHLAELVKDHAGCPLSVFGHADPVGDDDYNKSLSGRRALSIYALLIYNADQGKATGIWHSIAAQEGWGTKQTQMMQEFTGLPSGTSASTLMSEYMKKLSAAGPQLSPKDFLAQGADSGGKGDYQGCGEFNPVLIFSAQRQAAFDAAKSNKDDAVLADRDDENAPNRRVVVLLFRKGSRVDPAKWPCPRVTEGTEGCRRRFWVDGDDRRSRQLPTDQRTFGTTQDTFACRFYQRLSAKSPCESTLDTYFIRLFDRKVDHLPFAPWVVEANYPRRGRADQDGFIQVRDLVVPTEITVKWNTPQPGDTAASPRPGLGDTFEFEMKIFVDIPDLSDDAAHERLNNLGYDFDSDENNVKSFQTDYQSRFPDIQPSGQLDEATKKALAEVHDDCDPQPRKQLSVEVLTLTGTEDDSTEMPEGTGQGCGIGSTGDDDAA